MDFHRDKMKSEQGNAKICLLAVIMVTMVPITTVRPEPIFHKESPLLWERIDAPKTSNSTEFTLTLQLETPCRYLQKIDSFSCETEFNRRLFSQLEQLCPETVSFENQTMYRDLVRSVVLGIVPIYGNGGTVLNENTKRVANVERRIDLLQRRINAINEKINENIANVTSLHEELNKLLAKGVTNISEFGYTEKKVWTLNEQLQHLEADVNEMTKNKTEEEYNLFVALSSQNEDHTEWIKNMNASVLYKNKEVKSLMSYFVKLETKISTFSRSWRQGVLSNELFEILTLDGGNDVTVNMCQGAKPKSCQFSKYSKLLVLHLEKNFNESDITYVLEARPFRLYRRVPDTDNVETLTYQGPNNILYGTNRQCTVMDNGINTVPWAMDCVTFRRKHRFEMFWNRSCTETTHRYDDYVQIQQMGDKFFIYCYEHKINIYNMSLPCPNYVFSIDVSDKFEIPMFHIHEGSLKDQSHGQHHLITLKTNESIFPNMTQMTFDSITLSITCPTKLSIHAWIWLSIGSVVAGIPALAIASYLVRRLYEQARRGIIHLRTRFQLLSDRRVNRLVREEVDRQLMAVLEPPSYVSCENISVNVE